MENFLLIGLVALGVISWAGLIISSWEDKNIGPSGVLGGLFVFGVPIIIAVFTGDELALLTIIPCCFIAKAWMEA